MLATQHLLEELDIDFLGNDEWSGNLPDLNPTENLGSILMDRVGIALDKKRSQHKFARRNMIPLIEKILEEMSEKKELLAKLITDSY